MAIFNEEQTKLLKRALTATWQQIGADVEANCEDDNEIAVECCIDADRLTLNCGWGREGKADGDAAQALIREAMLVRKIPYSKILAELSRMVSFV